jgi:hypothetical protein
LSDKGKCYSMVDRGQRNKYDMYATPLGLVWSAGNIFKNLISEKAKILEPCAGTGALIEGLDSIIPNRIVPRDLLITGDDFYETKDKFDWIVTNPPYRNTERFIEKCYNVASQTMLLIPITHLQGVKRYEQQTYRHLKTMYVFNRMPMFRKDYHVDGLFTTGMQATAWFHFDIFYSGRPTIEFIDVQPYVVSEAEYLSDPKKLK